MYVSSTIYAVLKLVNLPGSVGLGFSLKALTGARQDPANFFEKWCVYNIES